MADKTVIVEIQYDTAQAIKNLDQLTATVEGEKVAQAKLRAELEAGSLSQKEYSIAIEKSKAVSGEANKQRKTTLELIGSEKGSVNELKANIKLLTAERDKLNQNTAEGKRAAQQYTDKINEMNASLKDSKKGTEETKGAFAALGDNLSSLPGPIGGVINGITGIMKAGLAFIATPIGAVIAAIGLALKALISYFKGSEDGQNKLNKALNVGKIIWDALMGIVQKVGEIIFEAISKPKETIIKLGELIKENLINRFTAFGVIGKAVVKIFKGDFKEGFHDLANGAIQAVTGVSGALEKISGAVDVLKQKVDEAAIAGLRIANLEKDLKYFRVSVIKTISDLQKISEVQMAISDDATKSFAEREEAAKKANKASIDSASLSVKLATKEYELIKAQNELKEKNGQFTVELRQQEAELYATKVEAEKNLLSNPSIKMSKSFSSLSCFN